MLLPFSRLFAEESIGFRGLVLLQPQVYRNCYHAEIRIAREKEFDGIGTGAFIGAKNESFRDTITHT